MTVRRLADTRRGMLRRLVRDEEGIALVLALITLLVLSSLTASVLFATAVNHRNAGVSAEQNKAFALGEQGVALAEGLLYTAPTSAANALTQGSTAAQDGGTIRYSGTYCDTTTTPACAIPQWTLTGVGTYQGVSRSVSVVATVPPPTLVTNTVADASVWSYIYVNSANPCVQFDNGATVSVPMYVNGNLCLSGGAAFLGSDLEVTGALTLSNGASIGKNNQPVARANAGTCISSGHSCLGDNNVHVAAPGIGSQVPHESMPTVDFADQYAHDVTSCDATSTGVPSHLFDNDSTMNNSNGSINLFPSGHSYQCNNGSGTLSWDGSSTLTVKGAFYFDGGLNMNAGGLHVVYKNSNGTLFFSGGFSISNGVTLCGQSTCKDTWDPSTNDLGIVAGCQGVSGACAYIAGGSTLQAAVWDNGYFDADNGSTDMGPIVTQTISLAGGYRELLPQRVVPAGIPVNTITTTTTVTHPPNPPSSWSG